MSNKSPKKTYRISRTLFFASLSAGALLFLLHASTLWRISPTIGTDSIR